MPWYDRPIIKPSSAVIPKPPTGVWRGLLWETLFNGYGSFEDGNTNLSIDRGPHGKHLNEIDASSGSNHVYFEPTVDGQSLKLVTRPVYRNQSFSALEKLDGAFTIEVKCRLHSTIVNNKGFMMRRTGAFKLWSFVPYNNVLYFEFWTGATQHVITTSYPGTAAGTLFWLTMVWDGARMQAYIGDELVGDIVATGTMTERSMFAVSLIFGAYSGGESDPSQQRMHLHHARIWDRALSQQEITEVVSSPYSRYEENAMDWVALMEAGAAPSYIPLSNMSGGMKTLSGGMIE